MSAARIELDRIVRVEYARLISYLTARCGRDISAAEDALSDAFAAALARWPDKGVPDKPLAWLLRVALNRLIDRARHDQMSRRALADVCNEASCDPADFESAAIPDDRLKFLFACAHPAIDVEARAPLMLQAVLGVPSAQIASAFVVSPAAMAQRLVRAKRRIRDAGIPFEIPESDQLAARLTDVLDGIYAAFGTSYDDTAYHQRGLAQEAIRLARILAELLPEGPEPLGLLALLLFCESRREARRDGAGRFVPLDLQETHRWSRVLFDEAELLLSRAAAMNAPGRYQIEAAIQSASMARCLRPELPHIAKGIVALYDNLLLLAPSIGAQVARAAALSNASDHHAAIDALGQLATDQPAVEDYQPYWAVRAAVLSRLGDPRATAAYDRAIAASTDAATRDFLTAQRQRP